MVDSIWFWWVSKVSQPSQTKSKSVFGLIFKLFYFFLNQNQIKPTNIVRIHRFGRSIDLMLLMLKTVQVNKN